MFCGEDNAKNEVEVTGLSTDVSYREGKDSEFFGTTHKSDADWEQQKAEMLQKDPR